MFLMSLSVELRGSFGLDRNVDCLLVKMQYEIGHLTLKNFEAKDDSKSSKILEAPQGAQIVTSCCQRTVLSFVKPIYLESVFHMIF
jgi:hypothetical protein